MVLLKSVNEADRRATRYCRGYDELGNFLRCRSRMAPMCSRRSAALVASAETTIVLAVLATVQVLATRAEIRRTELRDN
jgi:hypothetical protein